MACNCDRFIRCILIPGFFAMACSNDDPAGKDGNDIDDQPIQGQDCATPPGFQENLTGCQAMATDYEPRVNGSTDDSWPACISDDDTYHKIEESVSSIARVQAYNTIGQKLWQAGAQPAGADFTDMRVLFEEEQGLGSRVARRYDVHFPAPESGDCDAEGVAEANPDYCVGPAKIQPLVVDAFASGSQGKKRIVNAHKIRAALQWFFYVSIIKEATTCTETPKDCDSSWAYYTGGATREQPVGLAGEIKELAPGTHDRVHDAILAVRCWKNLDHEDGVSTDLTMRDKAITQLDTALLRGMAVLIRQRFAELECTSGDYQEAVMEELRILIPLLDRATKERDTPAASLLSSEIQKDPADVDVQACQAALDDVYDCP